METAARDGAPQELLVEVRVLIGMIMEFVLER
jgi:hypothetical protein